ncbi:unnamed protein product [Symbiodinium microadriaticum]|nr:unnamed protein product [Symbiodinium microadriaticum]
MLNVASCRAALASQRPCILAFVLFRMAGMLVSGVASIEDGAAHLRLVPTNPTTPPPATPTATRVPWPTSNTRKDEEIYEAIKDGKAAIRSTREPMTKKEVQVSMNNIQRGLKLKVGAGGGWSVEADLKLLRLLASSKKAYAKGNHAKAIKDVDKVLAIKDKQDDDDTQFGDILAMENTNSDDPDPTGLPSIARGSIDEHVPEDIDHNMLDEAVSDKDGPENINQTSPGEEAMDIDARANSSSSSSGSSSSSTHKSTLRRRARDLEGMLEDVMQGRMLAERDSPDIFTKDRWPLLDDGQDALACWLVWLGRLGIIQNMGDGCWNVLKVIYLEKSISSTAIQWALARVRGHHVHWHRLEDKSSNTLLKSSSNLWSPENDELAEGIRYINSFAPDCDARNEQTYWILTNIKPDSGTPLAGWPEINVRNMCQNKSRGVSGSVPKNEFPLTTASLSVAFAENILPLVYPLLLSAPASGVGKTPAIITMAMAIGRYHVRRLGLHGVKPGWRRGKSLDNFRQRSPQIQEALFLDDPSGRPSFCRCPQEGHTCSSQKMYYIRRLPSERPDAIVHRITKGDIHKDTLAEKDKHLYNTYKNGLTVYGASHAAEIEQEQAMIDERAEYLAGFPNVKNYVQDCNNALQTWLRPVRVLPDSPDSPQQNGEEAAGDLRLSLYIGSGPKANRVDRASFVIPETLVPEIEPDEEDGLGAWRGHEKADHQEKPSCLFPFAKKGKTRFLLKDNLTKTPTSNKVQTKKWRKTPYVKNPIKIRVDRLRWKRNLKDFIGVDEDATVKLLTEDGLLPDWTRMKCPFCNLGAVSGLQSRGRLTPRHRCRRKACQKFILPQHLHPIFTSNMGPEGHPLAIRASALLLRLASIPLSSIHIVLGINHKALESMEKKLVEAVFDKCLIAAEDAHNPNKTMKWEQWLGMVPRPGAVRKENWAKIASKWLKDRSIILHTDSARSYRTKIRGVLHDAVVHQKKKKVLRGGKKVWKPPTFVRLAKHKLPNGRKITVKAGTQVIDRAWRFLKERVKINQNTKTGSHQLTAKIRAAQYEYWQRGI